MLGSDDEIDAVNDAGSILRESSGEMRGNVREGVEHDEGGDDDEHGGWGGLEVVIVVRGNDGD